MGNVAGICQLTAYGIGTLLVPGVEHEIENAPHVPYAHAGFPCILGEGTAWRK